MTDSTTTVDVPGYKSGTWVLDPSHSEVTFSLRHMMISKVRGEFGLKSATITAPANPLEATVTASVDAASISTNDENRDNHLRSADFFDVETYPTMTFKATQITDDEITGDLTIKDVTKPVTFSYDFNGVATDPWGATRAGFEASGEINRNDFGMTFNAPLDGGGVLISEKIKINLDLEFTKA